MKLFADTELADLIVKMHYQPGAPLRRAAVTACFASLLVRAPWRADLGDTSPLARAMFDRIAGSYNPTRRHCTPEDRSPIDYEAAHAA
jgi:hypothetical protein